MTDTCIVSVSERVPTSRIANAKTGLSASDDSIYIVTGWTVPIKMDKESAVNWTAAMCNLGLEHDAEFDGWGTNPEQ